MSPALGQSRAAPVLLDFSAHAFLGGTVHLVMFDLSAHSQLELHTWSFPALEKKNPPNISIFI